MKLTLRIGVCKIRQFFRYPIPATYNRQRENGREGGILGDAATLLTFGIRIVLIVIQPVLQRVLGCLGELLELLLPLPLRLHPSLGLLGRTQRAEEVKPLKVVALLDPEPLHFLKQILLLQCLVI